MARYSDLVVKFKGDVTGFRSAIRTVNADLAAAANTANKASVGFRNVSQGLSDVGARLTLGLSAPLAAFGAKALSAFADIDLLKRGLETVTGSAETAEKQFREFREIAKLPGIGFAEALKGAASLQSLGFSADRTKRILREFSNAIAAVGGRREDLEETLRQLTQIGARGKVTMDNLRIVLERVPQLGKIMREEFGSFDTKALADQGVTAEMFFERMLAAMEKTARATGGLRNALDNLADNATIAFSKVGQAISPAAERVINEFADPLLEKMTELSVEFMTLPKSVQTAMIGTVGAVAAAGPVLFFFGQLGLGITGVVTGAKALVAILASAKTLFLGIGASMAGVLVPAITSLAGGLALTVPQFAAIGAAIAAAGYSVYQLIDAIVDYARAKQALDDANKDIELRIKSLEDKVKGLGVNLTYLRQVYDQGGYSAAQYYQKLTDIYKGLTGAADSTARVRTESEGAAGAVGKLGEEMRDLNRAMQGPATLASEVAAAIRDLTVAASNAKIQDLAKMFRGEFVAKQIEAIPSAVPAWLENNRIAFDELQRDISKSAVLSPSRDPFLKMGESLKSFAKEGKNALREVSTIFTDMSRGIANVIFDGGKMKDVFLDTAKEIGKALLRFVLQQGLLAISSQISGLLKNIPLIGKAFGKIGASAASGAIDIATSGASTAIGIAGKGAATAIGGVASSLTGVIGAVGSVAGAISGIIGNFQMAGMSKDLGKMERTLAGLLNQVRDGIQPQINQYLPALSGIHERLIQMLRDGLGVYPQPGYEWAISASGGGGASINQYFDGAYIMSPRAVDDIADAIVDSLRRRGVKI